MAGPEIEAFLSWLVNEQHVAASTHRQALSALLLYTKVLELQIPWRVEVGRPRVQRRLPVVLSQYEVAAVCGNSTAHSGCLRSSYTAPA